MSLGSAESIVPCEWLGPIPFKEADLAIAAGMIDPEGEELACHRNVDQIPGFDGPR